MASRASRVRPTPWRPETTTAPGSTPSTPSRTLRSSPARSRTRRVGSPRFAEAAGTQAIILTAFHHTGPLSLAEIMRFGVPDGWKLVSLTEALLSARSP